MKLRIDLTGQRFGRLVVLRFVANNKWDEACWECQCDCGNATITTGKKLRSGHTRSCGCLMREARIINKTIHGMAGTPIHKIWSNIKQRTSNPKSSAYKDYGGRGVKMCDRWFKSFSDFWKDVKDIYREGLTLDRIDNDKGYEPGNIRAATSETQANNRRSNIIWEHDGRKQSLKQWTKEYNINYHCVYVRVVKRGWDIERALITPPLRLKRKEL